MYVNKCVVFTAELLVIIMKTITTISNPNKPILKYKEGAVKIKSTNTNARISAADKQNNTWLCFCKNKTKQQPFINCFFYYQTSAPIAPGGRISSAFYRHGTRTSKMFIKKRAKLHSVARLSVK